MIEMITIRSIGILVLIATPIGMMLGAGDHSLTVFLGSWLGGGLILSAIGVFLECR